MTEAAPDIEPAAVFDRGGHVEWRVLEGEALLIHPGTARVIGLNRAASVIWEALDGQTPLAELVRERVCERFEVEEDRALQDAASCLAVLEEKGLVTRCP